MKCFGDWNGKYHNYTGGIIVIVRCEEDEAPLHNYFKKNFVSNKNVELVVKICKGINSFYLEKNDERK